MENHKNTLGILYIISAILQALGLLVVGLLVSFIVSAAFGASSVEDNGLREFVIALLSFLPVIILVVYILPSLIAGIGLVTKQAWALPMAMVVGFLKLLSFPIGTALGIYAIWVYFEDKKLQAVPPQV